MNAARSTLGIYCPGTGVGGPWRYVHGLLAAIDPHDFDVYVYSDLSGKYAPRPWVNLVSLNVAAVHHAGQAASATVTQAAEKTHRTGGSRFLPKSLRTWAGFAKESGRLSRKLRKPTLDLIHLQNTGCEEAPVAARWLRGPQVLGTFHVDSTYDLDNERSGVTHRVLERISNLCLHRAIAVSEATKQDWVRRSGIPADRVVTIHNGVDAKHFQRGRSQAAARHELGLPNDGRLIVGGVGRLDAAKGFAYLIEAAAVLAAEFPRLHVAIAGQGGLRGELEELARRRGIADRVQFLGQCADVRIVYDALDVYAMPSLCEALPYALLEAMSHELPVTAAAVGGIPEVIVEGETGFLTPPRDATAFATALRPLIESQELRTQLGSAGRERVSRHFTEADCVRKTIDVYRQMLGGATPAVSRR